MLPFHNSSSDSNPADPSMSAGAVSPAHTATHKKLSLRMPNEGATTREDDLSGPLLLNMGRGIEAHEYEATPYPLDLGGEPEFKDLPRPGANRESVLPSGPPEIPTTRRSQTTSLPEPSDGGASFSVPVDCPSSANLSHREITNPETQTTHSTSSDIDNRAIGLFPWKYQFSWEDSSLLFANEPFNVDGTAQTLSSKASPNSEIAFTTPPVSNPRSKTSLRGDHESWSFLGTGLFGVRASTESWAASDVARDLETESEAWAVSSTNSTSNSISKRDLDPQFIIAHEDVIDRLVMLLFDDYTRSYAPQRSQKPGSTTGKDQSVSHSDCDSTRRTERNGIPTKRASRQTRRKAIKGSGESEDGDSPDKGKSTSGTPRLKKPRVFACPFLKWRPESYVAICTKKMTRIRDVRAHLIKKHYVPYCINCYKALANGTASIHGCIKKPTAPVECVTDEKLEAINERADRRKSHEQQWQQFYGVLFPGEPMCLDPFLDSVVEEEMDELTSYVEHGGLGELLREEIKIMGFRGETAARFYKGAMRRFVPKAAALLRAYNSERHSHCDVLGKPTQDYDETAAFARSYQTLDADVLAEIALHSTQHPPDPTTATHTFSFEDLNGHTTTFGDQRSMDMDSMEIPDTFDVVHPEFTGSESNMWNTPIVSGEYQTDAEFSCLLFSEDETLETGNAEGSMWNI
ncbi:hypothetical protein EDB80DRAFT_898341 [Ilyonectria destructans]|nr:hypothetical protein EDB80DRAFT_898341 [Ilyonectria destructans]